MLSYTMASQNIEDEVDRGLDMYGYITGNVNIEISELSYEQLENGKRRKDCK